MSDRDSISEKLTPTRAQIDEGFDRMVAAPGAVKPTETTDPPTRPDWTMPAPHCDGCRPAYYADGNEIWLYFADENGEPCPGADGPDLEWPWGDDDQATWGMLKALGFVDVEDMLEVIDAS